MTRDAWCEADSNSNSRHAAKQLAERRARRRARLTQIGRKVEVLVLEQRDWYVGTVVSNDLGHLDGQGANLVAIKFSNGNVLHNVRSNELRPVPRATAAYWSLIALAWILCAVGACANILATAHTLRVGPYGDMWLFPDHTFDRIPNTTLYNLTYGEIAAADAYPEAWLAALLGQDVQTFRHQPICGAMRSDTLCGFRDSQDRLLGNSIGNEMLMFPLAALFFGSLGMQRLPLSYAITSLLCYLTAIASGSLFHEIATDWSRKHPSIDRAEVGQRAVRRAVLETIGWAAVVCILVFVIFPVMSALVRRNGKASSLSRVFVLYLVGLTFWVVVYLRVVHFLALLQDVAVNDSNLERLASNMMYLETSKQYLDNSLLWYIPTIVIIFCGLNRGRVWATAVVINCIIVIPLLLWRFAVVQPLPVLAPVSWQLTSTYLSDEYFLVFFLFRRGVFAAFAVVIGQAVIPVIFREFFTLRQITTLATRTRKALSNWDALRTRRLDGLGSSSRIITTGSGTKDYRPLDKRRPSVDVICPVADQLETYLAQPDARLHHNFSLCFESPFSAVVQMRQVLSATGITIAGYIARVVADAGSTQHHLLHETLAEVCACVCEHCVCRCILGLHPSKLH